MNTRSPIQPVDQFAMYAEKVVRAAADRILETPPADALVLEIARKIVKALRAGQILPKNAEDIASKELTEKEKTRDLDRKTDLVPYSQTVQAKLASILADNVVLKDNILRQTASVFEQRNSPEVVQNDYAEPEITNSLTTLFICWVLQNDDHFKQKDLSIFFNAVYRKDTNSEQLERYTEIANYFNEYGQILIMRFAEEAIIDGRENPKAKVTKQLQATRAYILNSAVMPTDPLNAEIKFVSQPDNIDYIPVLVLRAQNGDLTARNELTIYLIKSVRDVAFKIGKQKQRSFRLESDLINDLIQEGILKAMSKIPSINPIGQGSNMRAFMADIVSNQITRYVPRCLPVMVPTNFANNLVILRKLQAQNKTLAEITDELLMLGVSKEEVQLLIEYRSAKRLDETLGPDTDLTHLDKLAALPTIAENIEMLQTLVEDEIESLPEGLTSRALILLRYYGEDEKDVRSIGDRLGVSGNCVNKLLNEIIEYIQDPIIKKCNIKSVLVIDAVKTKELLEQIFRKPEIVEAVYVILGIDPRSHGKGIGPSQDFSKAQFNPLKDNPKLSRALHSGLGKTMIQQAKQELIELGAIKEVKDSDYLDQLSFVRQKLYYSSLGHIN